MSREINVNLEQQIDEFSEDIKEIAFDIINELNKSKSNNTSNVEELIERKINKIINGEK